MESPKTTSDPFRDQIRAAKAEGELAAIKDALAEFAEGNGFNPELEPRELLDKASGAFRSRAAISDMRYDEIRRLKEEIEAMRPRLMPEGMEWPVFEDGEPVRIGDEYVDTFGANTVATIEFGDGYSAINSNTPGGYVVGKCEGAHGRYVPRPAPKVLDADGVEIRVGDEVWPKYPSADRGEQVERAEVVGIQAEYGRVDVQAVYATGMSFREQVDANRLAHRKPVIAADGKPLLKGETVWSVDSSTRYTVEKITDELIPVKCRSEMGSTVSLHPSQLTHERPVADSWERIEEGVSKGVCGYFGHEVEGCCGCPAADDSRSCEEVMAEDVVRRCKALAGVERQ